MTAGEHPGADTAGILTRAMGELDELNARIKNLQALKKRLDEEHEEAICRR